MKDTSPKMVYYVYGDDKYQCRRYEDSATLVHCDNTYNFPDSLVSEEEFYERIF